MPPPHIHGGAFQHRQQLLGDEDGLARHVFARRGILDEVSCRDARPEDVGEETRLGRGEAGQQVAERASQLDKAVGIEHSRGEQPGGVGQGGATMRDAAGPCPALLCAENGAVQQDSHSTSCAASRQGLGGVRRSGRGR